MNNDTIKILQAEIDKLRKKNTELNSQKKYGLVWEDKPEIFDELSKNAFPILRRKDDKKYPDIDNPIDNPSEKGNQQPHILIEGDNYHTLSVLNITHQNKIDVIYIDPPYNTGNKDFKYNDSFVDKEDKFRHSKWLSFMHKRLELAKNLLTDDGVIFISIDDNEQGNLRVLCDEIFGENNFINNITVKSSEVSGVKMSHTSNRLPKIKEYLLCYACSKQLLILNALKIQKSDDDKQLNKYLKYYSKIITNFEDDVNNWNILPLQKYFSDNELKLDKEEIKNFKIYNAHRVIYRTNNKAFKNLDIKEGLQEIISSTGLKYICWEGKQMLFLKDYLEEGLCDLWNDISTINLNKEMTGLKSFENGQKPKELINRVLKLKNKNITVLDFFSGSGTTAHAVLELNQYDGSNRQCILATNNENGICEDITYERVKRVIEGYSTPKGKEVAGLGGALHYLKTDFVPKTDYGAISDKDKINFSHQVGIMLALKENTFNEMKSNDHYQIFTSDEKICGIYFSESLVELDELLDFMLEQDKPCYLYAYPELDEADFAKSNIILSEIPEHILQIYKNIGVVS